MSGGFADCGVVGVFHIEATKRRFPRVGHREKTLGESLQSVPVVDQSEVFSNLGIGFLFLAFDDNCCWSLKDNDDKYHVSQCKLLLLLLLLLKTMIVVMMMMTITTSLNVKASKNLFQRRIFSAHSCEMSLFACENFLLSDHYQSRHHHYNRNHDYHDYDQHLGEKILLCLNRLNINQAFHPLTTVYRPGRRTLWRRC